MHAIHCTVRKVLADIALNDFLDAKTKDDTWSDKNFCEVHGRCCRTVAFGKATFTQAWTSLGEVLDYRTFVSGVTASDLTKEKGAKSFEEVRPDSGCARCVLAHQFTESDRLSPYPFP